MARKRRTTRRQTRAKIRIKPSNRGAFTAKAKRAGKSVSAYAAYVLANKSRFSAATVKQANFARNARKWKKGNTTRRKRKK